MVKGAAWNLHAPTRSNIFQESGTFPDWESRQKQETRVCSSSGKSGCGVTTVALRGRSAGERASPALQADSRVRGYWRVRWYPRHEIETIEMTDEQSKTVARILITIFGIPPLFIAVSNQLFGFNLAYSLANWCAALGLAFFLKWCCTE
jgi:hypothetical protein